LKTSARNNGLLEQQESSQFRDATITQRRWFFSLSLPSAKPSVVANLSLSLSSLEEVFSSFYYIVALQWLMLEASSD
jgi:hypothetical protein